MATEYITSDQLKSTLELTGETFADSDIEAAIKAASRGIDNLCGRRFYADTDATKERYYTPDDEAWLRIDDLVELGSLQTDPDGGGTFEDTWVENTDFLLEPLNAPADAKPWTSIRVHPLGNFYLPCYPRSVKVTGKFGWATVPDEIVEATTVLASKLMRRAREAPFGVVAFGIEAGSAMRIARQDPDVLFLVGDLIRNRIAAA